MEDSKNTVWIVKNEFLTNINYEDLLCKYLSMNDVLLSLKKHIERVSMDTYYIIGCCQVLTIISNYPLSAQWNFGILNSIP